MSHAGHLRLGAQRALWVSLALREGVAWGQVSWVPAVLRSLCPQAFLTKVWWGQLCVDNGLWRVILCMLAFPLLFTGLISFRCGWALGGAPGDRDLLSVGRVACVLTVRLRA